MTRLEEIKKVFDREGVPYSEEAYDTFDSLKVETAGDNTDMTFFIGVERDEDSMVCIYDYTILDVDDEHIAKAIIKCSELNNNSKIAKYYVDDGCVRCDYYLPSSCNPVIGEVVFQAMTYLMYIIDRDYLAFKEILKDE